MLGGHIDVLMGNVSEAVTKGSEVLDIMVLSEERSAYLPDVQTAIEIGINVTNSSSRGVVAAKGLDENAKELLIAALKSAMEDPELLENAEKQGIAVTPIYGEEFAVWAETQEKNIKSIYDMLDD